MKEGALPPSGLFVGITTIDIQYLLDTFPESNAKTWAEAFTMTVGGPATNAAITFAHLGGDSHLLSVMDYDIVLVDGLNMDTCCKVAQQARQCAIPVVLDAGSWKEGMENLLSWVDVAICAEQFSSPDGGEEDAVLTYLARQGVRYRAITRGEGPIIYRTPEDAGEIAIDAVEVVDTLGAGDILHGAFCYYYAQDHHFVPALLQASRVATLSCQTFGTRSWMKS